MRFARPLLLEVAVALLFGCAEGGPDLEPSVPTDTPFTEDAVVDHVGGVEMTVQADAWPGASEVPDAVTPVQVTIENHSSELLSIRYRNFSLISPSGEYYAALPPFEVKASGSQAELAAEYPGVEPAIASTDFVVAPYFDPLYNEGVYEGSFSYNPDYYNIHYGRYETPHGHDARTGTAGGRLAKRGPRAGIPLFRKGGSRQGPGCGLPS